MGYYKNESIRAANDARDRERAAAVRNGAILFALFLMLALCLYFSN